MRMPLDLDRLSAADRAAYEDGSWLIPEEEGDEPGADE